jgi:hypothetical protein
MRLQNNVRENVSEKCQLYASVSELIHNSTDFQNLEFARVEVHFHEIVDKEGEDFEAVPGSDFIIAREVVVCTAVELS